MTTTMMLTPSFACLFLSLSSFRKIHAAVRLRNDATVVPILQLQLVVDIILMTILPLPRRHPISSSKNECPCVSVLWSF
jgi:hypothetical protein